MERCVACRGGSVECGVVDYASFVQAVVSTVS